MKIGEYIQRILSLAYQGVQHDTNRLTPRHIYNKMTTARVLLLTRKANKKQAMNPWNMQSISCIKLIEVDANQCPCLPPVGCSFLRSEHKIPKPLSSLFSPLITGVTSVDGSISYTSSTWGRIKYDMANKFTAGNPRWFIQNQYLYISGKDLPEVVMIPGGLFADPLEVEKFKGYCDDDDCADCADCEDVFEKEFPLDEDLADVLINMVKEELLGIPSNNNDNQQQQHEEYTQ